jgi:hypothetical protein
MNLPFRQFGRTLRMGDRPIARPVPTHISIKQRNVDIHPCLKRDSNSRSETIHASDRTVTWDGH